LRLAKKYDKKPTLVGGPSPLPYQRNFGIEGILTGRIGMSSNKASPGFVPRLPNLFNIVLRIEEACIITYMT
jgi:hypothetical protein